MATTAPAAPLANRSVMDQAVWDRIHTDAGDVPFDGSHVPFRDVFQRFLRPGGTCFEVGFYPGHVLAYLSKAFGYTVSGIDLTPFSEDALREKMVRSGATVGRLYQGDFLKFRPAERYDVVYSIGFLEHFEDTEDIIRRHVELLKPSGTLILTCPNFTKVLYLLHRWLDAYTLANHNVAAMDLGRWARALEGNGMRVEFQGYLDTIRFWAYWPHPIPAWKDWAIRTLSMATWFVNTHVDRPSSLFSPVLVSVSRKTE